MSISYKLKSHTSNFEDDQLLADHLQGTKNIALGIINRTGFDKKFKEEIKEVVDIICMTHDFGKASNYFQDYLKGENLNEEKNHGEISAYLAYYLLPEEWKLIGFMTVKKHHGDLNPNPSFFE